MTSDWDEIKRLAADFQKVQLTSTLQKLSERNIVEIVSLLIEKKLIKVIFTTDGKEYITPEHLEREVKDEIFAHGGRVNLVDVSKALNVDYSQIEEVATRIAGDSQEVHLLLGQLISEDYLTHVAQDINEKLVQQGEISLAELTQQLELPSDFLLQHVVEKHLGKTIMGRQDPTNPRVLFTQAYLQRCKAKLRGALAAITRPTNVLSIAQQINLPEKIFHTLADELPAYGFLTSKVANAQYVPHVYAEKQTSWVREFYKQNGFVEYEDVRKLGISEARQFVQKVLPNEEIRYLRRFALGSQFIDLSVLVAMSECQETGSYVDLGALLPTNFDESDIEELFNGLQKDKKIASNILLLNNIAFSEDYVNALVLPCYEVAHTLAKTAIESGAYQQFLADKLLAEKTGAQNDPDNETNMSKSDKREERRKKAMSGKLGGGSQGRETKTKSTKKHARSAARQADDSDEDVEETSHHDTKRGKLRKLELFPLQEIVGIFTKSLQDDGLEDCAMHLARLYHSRLNEAALKHAQELHETVPKSGARRNTHASTQEKVNNWLIDMRLYEKGSKLFPDDVQIQLAKYLLKSLGHDISLELTVYICNECNLVVKDYQNLSMDQCLKLAQDCDEEYRKPLVDLIKSVNRTIEEFLVSTENCLKVCSMIIKKIDKKKDRQLIVQHKDKLLQQLQSTTEPPLVLHLVVLILFTTVSGCILHASGKFVSYILRFLSGTLSLEENQLLQQYHDKVMKVLQTAANNSDAAKLVNDELQELDEKIKLLAQTYHKPGNFKNI